jgi:hypothetical protein
MIKDFESVSAGHNKPWLLIGAGIATIGMITLGAVTFRLYLPEWVIGVACMVCAGILLSSVVKGHCQDHHQVTLYTEYLRSLDVAILKETSIFSAISVRSRVEIARFLIAHHICWTATEPSLDEIRDRPLYAGWPALATGM